MNFTVYWIVLLYCIIVKKTSQFKTLCKDDCGWITQLKQQIWKRLYYLVAHRRLVNVLTSNSVFFIGGQKQLHISNPRPRFAYSLCNFYWATKWGPKMAVLGENGGQSLRFWFRDPQNALPCAEPRRLTYFASKLQNDFCSFRRVIWLLTPCLNC